MLAGAYMYSERERAQVLSLPDPIQPDLESTHQSFNTGVSFVLKSMADSHWTKDPSSLTVKPLCMTVASHNEDSIAKTQELMKQHGIPISDGVVSFAQLMGMQDGTTYQLAAKGIKAYKVSVPRLTMG